jgi:hypothetical protein
LTLVNPSSQAHYRTNPLGNQPARRTSKGNGREAQQRPRRAGAAEHCPCLENTVPVWGVYTAGPVAEATGESAGEDDSDAILWAALSIAPEEGIPAADLVAATGMSHRWVNYRLRALAGSGQATQLKRGMWRAITPEGDTP